MLYTVQFVEVAAIWWMGGCAAPVINLSDVSRENSGSSEATPPQRPGETPSSQVAIIH